MDHRNDSSRRRAREMMAMIDHRIDLLHVAIAEEESRINDAHAEPSRIEALMNPASAMSAFGYGSRLRTRVAELLASEPLPATGSCSQRPDSDDDVVDVDARLVDRHS